MQTVFIQANLNVKTMYSAKTLLGSRIISCLIFLIILAANPIVSLGQNKGYENQVFGISIATNDNGTMYTFDQDNPAELDVLTSTLAAYTYYQSGDIVNGDWYVYGGWDEFELFKIDTATGVQILVAEVDVDLTGISYSVTDQKMYACDATNFYILDLITGDLTLVGAMGNAGFMKGLASTMEGEIYGIDWDNSSIYTIDPLTGAATLITALDISIQYPLDGTINRNTGEYILVAMASGTMGEDHMFKVDLETGVTTSFGAFENAAQMTALAIPYITDPGGEFNGTVVNTNGEPIENAIVKIVSDEFELITLTDDDGIYIFPSVSPGNYDFLVTAESYVGATVENIEINIDDVITTDFTLVLSELSVTFTVEDDQNQPMEGAMISLVSDTLYTNVSGVAQFEHVSPGIHSYKISEDGFYHWIDDLELTNSNLNISIQMIADVNITKHLVVLEEATGTWCQYCPAASNGCDDLLQENYPVAVIAYHTNDSYTTDESDLRLNYYNVPAYPTVYFDGGSAHTGGGNASESLFDVYVPIVDEQLAITSPIEVSFSNTEYNSNTRILSADVDVDVIGIAYGSDYRLQVVLTESEIEESWYGLDILNFVARDMYNGANGTSIDLSTMGSSESVSVSFALNDSWNEDECEIIAFVQDHESHEILNANKFSLLTVGTDSPIMSNAHVSIYPNPAANYVNITSESNIISLEIMNNLGQFITHREVGSNKFQMNTAHLEKGIYFVKIFTQDNVITKKLVIE